MHIFRPTDPTLQLVLWHMVFPLPQHKTTFAVLLSNRRNIVHVWIRFSVICLAYSVCHANPATQAFLSVAKVGLGPSEWLKANQDWWPLLPVDATTKILTLGPKEPWTNVAQEIQTVMGCSLLGKRLLVHQVLAKVEKKLLSGPVITRKSLADLRAKTLQKVKDAVACELLEGRREVSVLYRGWSVSTRVRHVSEQVDVTLMAAVRGYAAASGAIPALPAEAFLCQADAELQQGLVSEELLREAEAVRNQTVTLLSADSCSSEEQVKEWVVHVTLQFFPF